MPFKDRTKRLEYMRKHNREYRKELRREVLRLLGEVCVYCGCDDSRLLEINHRNGGGTKESFGSYRNREGKRNCLRSDRLYVAILRGKRTTAHLETVCRVCNAWHYIGLKFGAHVRERFSIKWSRSADSRTIASTESPSLPNFSSPELAIHQRA